MSKKENNNVSVGVRIRPLNDKELQSNMPVCFAANGDGNAVKELDHENQEIVKNWPYDSVFGPSCSNKFIFDTMGAKLVDAAIDGYNTVLFMYGQTSSGMLHPLKYLSPLCGFSFLITVNSQAKLLRCLVEGELLD